MAKKETKAPEGENTATPAPAAAVAAEKGQADKFVRLFTTVDGKEVGQPPVDEKGAAKKVAPQLQAIANTLEAFGPSGCSRKELIEALSQPNVLTTRQPVGRILSYYQKDLQKYRIATVTKA